MKTSQEAKLMVALVNDKGEKEWKTVGTATSVRVSASKPNLSNPPTLRVHLKRDPDVPLTGHVSASITKNH
jgi:hypothetical protein